LTGAAALAAIALPAVVLPLAGPSHSALVVFPGAVDPSTLPDGIAIESWGGRTVRLVGVDARAARALYGLGAIFVYPVRAAGCLELSLGTRKPDGRGTVRLA
jgi:hypothetical protein